MCSHRGCIDRRRFLLAAAAAGLLSACGKGDGGKAGVAALEIEHGTSCALDGMLLADYPGPKAQVHYSGVARPDWFCDTLEMFNVMLNPEQARLVTAVYVQDMSRAAWESPQGHWIDARTAFYVFGSKRLGSMGPTAASFSAASDAQDFAARHGGKVYRYDEVQPGMAILDGGALHDQSM